MRGFKDSIPPISFSIEHIKKIFNQHSCAYGFDFVDLPIVEEADLYFRTSGEQSDICNKELFKVGRWGGSNDESWCLRPEGTASCMRAILESHYLQSNKFARFAYFGPMFRYNRPQKGRYRQFLQAGWEVVGQTGVQVDCEMIIGAVSLVEQFNLEYVLEINSIGSVEDRVRYREILKNHFKLDDAQDPLKVLDKLDTFEAVPVMELNNFDRAYYDDLCDLLIKNGIQFKQNPYLVRGLDYYNSTVFEIKLKHADAAQTTVLAGGRYDGLMEQLGGTKISAFGFAAGVDRIADYMDYEHQNRKVALIILDAVEYGMQLAKCVRSSTNRGVVIFWNIDLKKGLAEASKQGYEYAMICGRSEMNAGTVVLKNLRKSTQNTIPFEQILEAFA